MLPRGPTMVLRRYAAGIGQHDTANDFAQGPTPLIAAMRCYVASQLGDEVEVPEELKGVMHEPRKRN
jgi:hypothetical protein